LIGGDGKQQSLEELALARRFGVSGMNGIGKAMKSVQGSAGKGGSSLKIQERDLTGVSL
jgi:hypothetical protein